MKKCNDWIATKPCYAEAEVEENRQKIVNEIDDWFFTF